MNERIFAEGLYVDRNERAPDFVICKLGVDVKRFVAWLERQPVSEKGYLNIQVTRSRDGTKYSAALDTWKPSGERSSAPREVADAPFDDSADIPF